MPQCDSDVEAARILPADGPAAEAPRPQQTAASAQPKESCFVLRPQSRAGNGYFQFARKGAIAAVAASAAIWLAFGVLLLLLKPPWGARGATGGDKRPSLPVYAAFEMVDGGSDHACRSMARPGDDNETRTAHASSSLANCKALCVESVQCRGIGFREGQCDVWTVAVEAGTPAKGLACFRYVMDVSFDYKAKSDAVKTTGGISAVSSMRFDPIDGGANRACRGADAGDDAGNNKVVVFSRSLFDCKAKCLARNPCTGIEFTSGRCEIWKVPITVTVPKSGFSCFKHRPGAKL